MSNKRARYGATIDGERTGHLVHSIPRKAAIEKAQARIAEKKEKARKRLLEASEKEE